MTRLSLHLSFATIQDFMLNSAIFYNTSISHEQFDSMPQSIGRSWSSLVEGDEGYIAQVASCTVYDNPPPITCMATFTLGANPVVHLLLLKSSMGTAFMRKDSINLQGS